MWYEYRCQHCENVYETQTFTKLGRALNDVCCDCGGVYIRIVSIPQITPAATDPTWNYTVGDYVTSSKDFEQKLAIGQNRMSERLGYEQKFTPVYPSERQAYVESTANNDGASGESMEKYARLRNDINDKRTIII